MEEETEETFDRMHIRYLSQKAELTALRATVLGIVAIFGKDLAKDVNIRFIKAFEEEIRREFDEAEMPGVDKAIAEMVESVYGVKPSE